MIRRNHIEAVTRIDRHQLKQQLRDPPSSHKNQLYLYRKVPEVVVDENFRATSNNKKYHQYKDWKEQHRKSPEVEEFKAVKQPAEPLSEVTCNLATHKIRQEYQKELQTMLNRQYTSQTDYEPRRRRTSLSASPAPYNYLQSHPKGNFQPEIPSYENSATRNNFQGATLESSWKRSNNNSNHKNSSFHQKQYNNNLFKDKLTDYKDLSSSFDCKPLKAYNFSHPSPSIPVLPFHSTQPYNRSKLQELEKKLKGAYEDDCIRERGATDCLRRLKAEQRIERTETSIEGRPLQAEQSRRGDQKVAQKLKLISSFNDQINDRIKNIITCFEELRTKL